MGVTHPSPPPRNGKSPKIFAKNGSKMAKISVYGKNKKADFFLSGIGGTAFDGLPIYTCISYS